MKLETCSTSGTGQSRVSPPAFRSIAIVHGSVDGWFWAECRGCSWPGRSHRDSTRARADADRHNDTCHVEDPTDCSQGAQAPGASLDVAFRDYRCGHYDRTLATLRKILLEAAEKRDGKKPTAASDCQGLEIRALAFLQQIDAKPTSRETAAALVMTGALLGC